MRSASAIFMPRTEAITRLPQIVTLRGCEELKNGRSKGYKGSNHDASTVAPAVGEKAHLGTKQH